MIYPDLSTHTCACKQVLTEINFGSKPLLSHVVQRFSLTFVRLCVSVQSACVRACVSAIVCACACVCVRVVQRLSSFLNNRQIASKCCPRPCRFHLNNDSVIQAMRTFQTFTPKFQPEIMVDSCDESFEMSAWLGQCYHHFDEISLLFQTTHRYFINDDNVVQAQKRTKIARFRTHYFRDVICIREYSNRAKFNTFLLNHLWAIGPVENDLKKSVKLSQI